MIAGYDPADAITAESQGKIPAGGYRQFLVQDGLQGTRIGVLRQLITETADPEIVQLFEQALADMRKHGAHIVDPVRLSEHEEIPLPARFCNRFKFDINTYLASLGAQAPVKNFEEILASRKFHPSIVNACWTRKQSRRR